MAAKQLVKGSSGPTEFVETNKTLNHSEIMGNLHMGFSYESHQKEEWQVVRNKKYQDCGKKESR